MPYYDGYAKPHWSIESRTRLGKLCSRCITLWKSIIMSANLSRWVWVGSSWLKTVLVDFQWVTVYWCKVIVRHSLLEKPTTFSYVDVCLASVSIKCGKKSSADSFTPAAPVRQSRMKTDKIIKTDEIIFCLVLFCCYCWHYLSLNDKKKAGTDNFTPEADCQDSRRCRIHVVCARQKGKVVYISRKREQHHC